MKKFIIWDLCGGSQNSVYKAVKTWNKLDKYEIYTFDIFEEKGHENQHIWDFTKQLSDFYNYIKIHNIPKPHFILASPLCQTFSILMNCGKGERVCWKFNEKFDMYQIRSVEEIANIIKNNNFLKQNNPVDLFERAVMGETILWNIIRIINDIKPFAWYIENPQTSLMWEYIEMNCGDFIDSNGAEKNVAHYNSYDLSFTQKPTTFLSNYTLMLNKFGIKGNIKKKNGERLPGASKNETGERVKIPALLIIDILSSFEAKYQGWKEFQKIVKKIEKEKNKCEQTLEV